MHAHARALFTVAAVANFGVALGLLFLRPQLTPLLGLDPAAGTNAIFLYLAATMIGLFGYSYLRVAGDPRRFRPFIELGVIGKLLAVVAAGLPWLAGEVSWQLPLLISGDLVFVLLFVDYLRRTQPV